MKRVTAEGKCADGLPPKGNRAPGGRLVTEFIRDEDGGLGWLIMTFFFIMVLMGGLAVDLMRFEYTRTALQQTADRSALASASLHQELDATDVVHDYFDKDNNLSYLTSVDVQEGLNFKTVTVDAARTQPTFFMHMMGIDTLKVPAHSAAEERITNVEIALVLDVSRSMILYENGSSGNEQKFQNVKTAAKQFITDVLSKDVDSEGTSRNRFSISIVPYNGQVNLGPTLFAKYTGIYDKPGIDQVYCVDLPSSTYNSASLSASQSMPATGLVDTFSGTGGAGASYTAPSSTTYYGPTSSSSNQSSHLTPGALNRWCPQEPTNYVRLPSNSASTLRGYVDNLEAIGATSINAGIKWGLTMLDPGTRTMFDQLRSSGAIPAGLTGRPFDYDDEEAMKVIVLMTDGSNFAEERLNNGWRTGTSPVYFDLNTKVFSIHHPTYTGSSNKYYNPSDNTWTALPKGAVSSTNTGTSVRLNWQEIWAGFSKSVKVGSTTYSYNSSGVRASWVAWHLYARALGTSSSTRTSYYNSYIDQIRTRTSISTMDSQLQKICTLAKQNNVIVYGIAFEAPSAGQTQIAKCAQSIQEAGRGENEKSSAFYFESDGSKIGTDFKTIASNISQLRLTQ